MKTILSHITDALSATHRSDLASPAKVRRTQDSSSTSASSSKLHVAIIDVGKGDCIILHSSDSSVLIDTGYESTAGDVLAHLKGLGVNHLDAMIITHYDRDHVDGIQAIGKAIRVDTVHLPGYQGSDRNYRSCVSSVKALGVPSKQVTRELTLNIGKARLTVFPSGVTYVPGAGKVEGNDNDMSLVATLVNGRDTYLFTGDLEEDGISAYLKANHGRFDVLKVPHHGESSANTAELLDDVCPKIAVITDSLTDAADKKTLKLLKAAGVKTHRTATDGTVVVESDGSGTYSVTPSQGQSYTS